MQNTKPLNWNVFIRKLEFLIILLPILFVVNFACSQKLTAPVLSSEIEDIQYTLASQQDATLDLKNAQSLIDKSRAYVHSFPKDTLAPVYLFRAADVARGIGQYDLAVALWEQVQLQYLTFEKVPDALFMQGFTLENNLKNTDVAKKYYERFVQQYPHHHLITTVEVSLKNLSKSPEELIKEFEKKQ